MKLATDIMLLQATRSSSTNFKAMMWALAE